VDIRPPHRPHAAADTAKGCRVWRMQHAHL
jgi:hypothetical protein